VDGYLYLDRYWREEELVRNELDRRAAEPALPVDTAALQQVLARVFTDRPPDRQRLAAAMTALRSLTVLAGGPGTGKTTTVARLLAMLRGLPEETPRVALAAPTGKAAARLQEAVEAGRCAVEHRRRGRRRDDHPSAAGLSPGQPQPVQPRPEQPAPVRRGDHR
jgi:exodeoxyribonuclease V alpha subunit